MKLNFQWFSGASIKLKKGLKFRFTYAFKNLSPQKARNLRIHEALHNCVHNECDLIH